MLKVERPTADALSMIGTRFVVMAGTLAVLGAGVAVHVADGRSGQRFVGATDAAHVAVTKAMLAGLPTPAGLTLDPFGTACDLRASACFTSSSVEPEKASAAMTSTLVAHGARVRSHACPSPRMVEHGCQVVVDYRGSGIAVTAHPGRRGNPHTVMRLSVSGADAPQPALAAARYGSWASVDPLPSAWTAGVTCVQPSATGCSDFRQPTAASPVVAATTAQACAAVRRVMEGRYSLAVDTDRPATASDAGGCGFFGHRYRTVGGTDGEVLAVRVTTKDAGHVVVSVSLTAWS